MQLFIKFLRNLEIFKGSLRNGVLLLQVDSCKGERADEQEMFKEEADLRVVGEAIGRKEHVEAVTGNHFVALFFCQVGGVGLRAQAEEDFGHFKVGGVACRHLYDNIRFALFL